MKRFAFVSEAAQREYTQMPRDVQHQFGASLQAIQREIRPFLPIKAINSIGAGVIELKINGSPAFRCIYIAKYNDTVYVLHTFRKTTNGVDKKAMCTAELRYKELKAQLKQHKR